MDSAMQTATTEVDVAHVEISLTERTDALVLMAALIPFNSFLVQHTREHWVVHARVPGRGDEGLEDLVGTVERWAARRGLSDLTFSLAGESVQLTATRPGS
jgi:hypothetical protein